MGGEGGEAMKRWNDSYKDLSRFNGGLIGREREREREREKERKRDREKE